MIYYTIFFKICSGFCIFEETYFVVALLDYSAVFDKINT